MHDQDLNDLTETLLDLLSQLDAHRLGEAEQYDPVSLARAIGRIAGTCRGDYGDNDRVAREVRASAFDADLPRVKQRPPRVI